MDGIRKQKASRILIIMLGSLLVIAIGALIRWSRVGVRINNIGASYYGIRPINSPQGQLYAKREARGQNFDVVAISKNPSICTPANPDTDLIFRYDADPLLVSESPDTLFVYWSGAVAQPKTSLPGVIVKQVKPGSSKSEIKNLDSKIREIEIPLEYMRHGTGACTQN
jgi:hypothetical protein